MKRIIPFIVLLVGSLGLYAYNQWLKAKDYNFQVLRIIVTKLSLNQIIGFLSVELINKTDFAANVLSYQMQIFAEGKNIGQATSEIAQQIPSKSKAIIDVAFASTSLNNLLDSILTRYIASNNLNLLITFTGTIKVQFYHKTLELPVNYTATIKQLIA